MNIGVFMSKLRFFLIFSLSLYISGFSEAYTTNYIEKNFDESMCIKDSAIYNLMLRSKYSQEYLNFYRDIYNKNLPSKLPYSKEVRIPKIMHRLWVGHRKMPELYKKYDKNCKKLHPDWQHILWTDKEIDKLKLDKLYFKYKKRKQYSAQKDVVLHEVLYKYGGVFMDTDFDCLQNFDELHHKYDFYASLEPGVGWSKIPVQTIAIVGSAPGNHVFKKSLLKANLFFKVLLKHTTNGKSLSKSRKVEVGLEDAKVLEYCNKLVGKIVCIRPDPRFVMMHSLASAFKSQYREKDKSIVFPASYFNPVFPRSLENYSLFEKLFMIDLKIGPDPYCYNSVKPEAIAVQDFND